MSAFGGQRGVAAERRFSTAALKIGPTQSRKAAEEGRVTAPCLCASAALREVLWTAVLLIPM